MGTIKVTSREDLLKISILSKLTYFFGGMFVYSILFGLLYKGIGVWGGILALITGIFCAIYLIIKKQKQSPFRILAYGVLLAITIWFLVALSFAIVMVAAIST
jgi:hypothetical protein